MKIVAQHDAKRFWAKVKKSAMCWHWMGTLNQEGYGIIKLRGKKLRAHRVAYETLRGPIPDGLQLDHLCRNRGCVNPAHLEPVTNAENQRRSIGKRKIREPFCLAGHRQTDENTYISRSHRLCRECKELRERNDPASVRVLKSLNLDHIGNPQRELMP